MGAGLTAGSHLARNTDMTDAEFWLIVGAGLALVSAFCFLFPGFGNILFWRTSAGEDNGIAYVFAMISGIMILIGLWHLFGLI